MKFTIDIDTGVAGTVTSVNVIVPVPPVVDEYVKGNVYVVFELAGAVAHVASPLRNLPAPILVLVNAAVIVTAPSSIDPGVIVIKLSPVVTIEDTPESINVSRSLIG